MRTSSSGGTARGPPERDVIRQNGIGNAGGLLAPIVAGFLLQGTGSWSPPLMVAAVVALAGAAICTFMLSDRARFAAAATPEHRGAAGARA